VSTQPRHEPIRIAPETFAIQHLHGGDRARPGLYVNSLVIRGREPVVIDTGTPAGADRWLEDVWALVDPGEVRWIVVSQDDAGHVGSLDQLLRRCPRATIVASRSAVARLVRRHSLPPARVRGLAEGEGLDVGDRVLHPVRPPVYHGPATRGFFDPATGVYWSSDAFGLPVAEHVDDAGALPADARRERLEAFGLMLAPWARDVGPRYWAGSVARVASLAPGVIAGVHGPVFRGSSVAHALAVYAGLQQARGPVESDQQALDAAVGAFDS
jgi:flavorubredoxin